jgi:hypothetical protein
MSTHVVGVILMNSHLQTHRSGRSSIRARLTLAGAALAFGVFGGLPDAAAEGEPPPQTPKREQLTIAPEEALKPWTGDLDGMIDRKFIRILKVYSKTFYFVDKGVQRGRSPTYSGSSRRI